MRPQVQVTVSLRRLRTTSPLGVVDDNDQAAWAAGQRVRRPLFGLPADQFPDNLPGGIPDGVPDGQQPGDVPLDTDG